MLTILVLFVGLTLATAVIAYWSDNLGKKLGKKRVSLWGLRPRTTATFLTIASSWLIMVFTLGVLLTIFPPLSQSLLRYDEVKANESNLDKSAKRLTGQVSGLKGQLTELRNQTRGLETQVKSASVKLKDVRGQLTKSREASDKARKGAAAARKEAANARKSAGAALSRQKTAVEREQSALGNLKNVRGQLGTTRQQREIAERQLENARGNLKRARADVTSANAKVSAANARVAAADAQVALAEAQFRQAELNLQRVGQDLKLAKAGEQLAVGNAKAAQFSAERARANASLAEAKADLAEARATKANTNAYNAGKQAYSAGKEILAAQKEVAEAEKRVAQLQEQSDKLSLANEALFKVNARISDEADIILSSDIRVPIGRTLVARSFEQGTSFSEATQGLRALFGRAADKSVPGFLPGARLQLAPRTVLAPKEQSGDSDVSVLVRDDEIFNGLANAISRSQNPLSVRLVSERNHLEGEKTLYARFIVVPVRPALPADEELARANFDGRTGDAQLFSALLKLVEAGREVASQSGVTPPLSPEAPDFYAPGSNEQIFVALRKISAFNNPVRVRILTAEPINTTDQLSVRFEVEPLGATTAKNGGRKAPA